MTHRFLARINLKVFTLFALVALFALGLGLRVLDLTDPPLDFHATRQLHAAIIARGMYYQMQPSVVPAQRDLAVRMWKYQEVFEPPMFERLVALTYLVTGSEHVWIARLYSILFWLIGGAALFALARRMLSGMFPTEPNSSQAFAPAAGALVALAYYLVVPYGVTASRSFQPDPLMVMWILLAAYTLFRWGEEPTWKWAVLSSLFGGLAILTKVVAIFPVLAVLLAIALASAGLRKAIKNIQVWVMAGVIVLLPALYYLFTTLQRSEGMATGILPLTLKLLRNPKFYTGWFGLLDSIVGLPLIVIGMLGVLLLPPKSRAVMAGLWGGFWLYGLVFAYPISTHDYYNLPIIPVVALSLAVVGAWLLGKAAEQPLFWKVVFAGVLVFALGYPAWLARSALLGVNYRNEIKGWQQMGAELPTDGPIIALSHDYGNRLQYYAWRLVVYWPTADDIDLKALQGDKISEANFQGYFDKQIKGRKYFLITLLGELNAQPLLKSMLYDHYTPIVESKGYILFDLSQPLATP